MQNNLDIFHGTSKQTADVIIREGFKKSTGDEQWLGDGVYFFTNGLSDPQNAAQQWAEYKAWDNNNRRNTYTFAAVIKAVTEVDDDNLLDLTTEDGVKVLDYIENHCIKKKLLEVNVKDYSCEDGYLINFAREQIDALPDIKVIVGDVFIQLNKSQRIKRIHRHTPNCTICCVNDTDCITNVELLKSWRI
jgi:hypothetical protein